MFLGVDPTAPYLSLTYPSDSAALPPRHTHIRRIDHELIFHFSTFSSSHIHLSLSLVIIILWNSSICIAFCVDIALACAIVLRVM